MWNYEKRLQYPVNISRPNAEIAKVIISQFGGPDGEVGAAMRYLSQRYSNTNRKVAGVLTDIGVSVVKLRMGDEKMIQFLSPKILKLKKKFANTTLTEAINKLRAENDIRG